MKIEKRGNSYRVRSMYKGKSYSLSFDHKPTQKEITLALAAKMEGVQQSEAQGGTLESHALRYIEDRRKRGLSPTTLTGYKVILRNSPEWYLALNIFDITPRDVQKAIDEFSENHSAKTTANFNGFYAAVFASYRPQFSPAVKLPRRVKKFRYEPSTKDVARIIEAVKGSRYSLFIQLAALGLRRGEIGALEVSDLSDDNILTINKDMIQGEDGKYVVKDVPKTSASNRRILIPAAVADEIRARGFIFKGNLHTVTRYLGKVEDELGIPRFPLHTLRHFAAAYLNKKGFTKDQILEYCGWEKGSSVMERVYSYNLDPEESQKDIASAFDTLL